MASLDLPAVIDFGLAGLAVGSLLAAKLIERWRRHETRADLPASSHRVAGDAGHGADGVGAGAAYDRHAPP